MRATLSADNQVVTMQGDIWSTTFPTVDLAAQLAFYRGLWSRGAKDKGQPGPYAKHYEPTITALERVRKIAAAMGAI